MAIFDIRCLKVRNDTTSQQLVSQSARKRNENFCISEKMMKEEGLKNLGHKMSCAENKWRLIMHY